MRRLAHSGVATAHGLLVLLGLQVLPALLAHLDLLARRERPDLLALRDRPDLLDLPAQRVRQQLLQLARPRPARLAAAHP